MKCKRWFLCAAFIAVLLMSASSAFADGIGGSSGSSSGKPNRIVRLKGLGDSFNGVSEKLNIPDSWIVKAFYMGAYTGGSDLERDDHDSAVQLTSGQFTVYPSDGTGRTITFSGGYLDSLPIGDHILEISASGPTENGGVGSKGYTFIVTILEFTLGFEYSGEVVGGTEPRIKYIKGRGDIRNMLYAPYGWNVSILSESYEGGTVNADPQCIIQHPDETRTLITITGEYLDSLANGDHCMSIIVNREHIQDPDGVSISIQWPVVISVSDSYHSEPVPPVPGGSTGGGSGKPSYVDYIRGSGGISDHLNVPDNWTVSVLYFGEFISESDLENLDYSSAVKLVPGQFTVSPSDGSGRPFTLTDGYLDSLKTGSHVLEVSASGATADGGTGERGYTLVVTVKDKDSGSGGSIGGGSGGSGKPSYVDYIRGSGGISDHLNVPDNWTVSVLYFGEFISESELENLDYGSAVKLVPGQFTVSPSDGSGRLFTLTDGYLDSLKTGTHVLEVSASGATADGGMGSKGYTLVITVKDEDSAPADIASDKLSAPSTVDAGSASFSFTVSGMKLEGDAVLMNGSRRTLRIMLADLRVFVGSVPFRCGLPENGSKAKADDITAVLRETDGGVEFTMPSDALKTGKNEVSVGDADGTIRTKPVSVTRDGSNGGGGGSGEGGSSGNGGTGGGGCDSAAGAGLLSALALLGLVKIKR